uniref:junctional adhesion molecule-like n=1 Tax=Myxine glutinosa TaxID=7769 RepID=UPI00358FB0B7
MLSVVVLDRDVISGAISESQSTKVITTTSGMTAILPCVFQSKEKRPVYSVKWTTGEDIIFSYKETRSPKESFSKRWAINLKLRGNIPAGDATITLLNVTEDDKGEYICRVSENYRPKKDIKITLQVRPKEEPKNPKGDNIDDAQRQGLSTTMAVLPFVSSSKSDSPRVNSPKGGCTRVLLNNLKIELENFQHAVTSKL